MHIIVFLFFFYLIKPRFYCISAGLMRSTSHGNVSMMTVFKIIILILTIYKIVMLESTCMLHVFLLFVIL